MEYLFGMRTVGRKPALSAQRMMVRRGQRDFVTALARGLDVMRAFSGQQEEPLTLADIAKLVQLPRATVRRSLITLRALGYIEESGKVFRLAPKVLTLAQAYLSSKAPSCTTKWRRSLIGAGEGLRKLPVSLADAWQIGPK
jgi:hypothetical protein